MPIPEDARGLSAHLPYSQACSDGGHVSCVLLCRTMTMTGHPTFNQEKLTKRAKRSVGFVLQASVPYLLLIEGVLAAQTDLQGERSVLLSGGLAAPLFKRAMPAVCRMTFCTRP